MNSVDEFVKYIETSDKNNAIYEVLHKAGYVRCFFDVEGIPEEQDRLIYEIADELRKYAEIDELPTITENRHSQHEGRSYHIYLPVRMRLTSIKNLVCKFIQDYSDESYQPAEDIPKRKELARYIDHCVYGERRLFRVPNHRGANYRTGQDSHEDDVHHIITPDSKLADTIISCPPKHLRKVSKFDLEHADMRKVEFFKQTCQVPRSKLLRQQNEELRQECQAMNKKLNDLINQMALLTTPPAPVVQPVVQPVTNIPPTPSLIPPPMAQPLVRPPVQQAVQQFPTFPHVQPTSQLLTPPQPVAQPVAQHTVQQPAQQPAQQPLRERRESRERKNRRDDCNMSTIFSGVCLVLAAVIVAFK